jgi:hypothetical protein
VSFPTKPLALAVTVLALTAGCVGPSATGGGPETATAEPPVETATPTAEPDPTTGVDSTDTKAVSTEAWSNQPDPDKRVHLENAWNRSVDIRLRVVRAATNETVHEKTYTLAPGAEREVYTLAEADPDGIESFRVSATARNTTESVAIETNVCYGGAHVEVTEDGTLYPYYSIC